MTPTDLTKPVQTVNGLKARIICTDAKLESGRSVIALVTDETGLELMRYYWLGGRYLLAQETSDFDLVNIPEKIERWVNVYPGGMLGSSYLRRKEADHDGASHRIACIHLVSHDEGKTWDIEREGLTL